MECQHCKKTLSSLSNLKVHQMTAKYCLKLQNITDHVSDTIKYKCSYCNAIFNLKYNLSSHKKICKSDITLNPLYEEIRQTNEQQVEEINKLRQTNEQQVEEITKLRQTNEQQVEEITKLRQTDNQQVEEIRDLKTSIKLLQQNLEIITNEKEKLQDKSEITITNINITKIVNNFLENAKPVTVDYIKQCAEEQLTLELYKKGLLGYASFACDILKDQIVSTDLSRGIIKYKDENGLIKTNIGHGELVTSIFKGVEDRTNILAIENRNFYMDLGFDQYEIKECGDIPKQVKDASNGIECQESRNFVKKLNECIQKGRLVNITSE